MEVVRAQLQVTNVNTNSIWAIVVVTLTLGTFLSAFDDYETLGYAWCAQCIAEEQQRRVELE